MKANELRFGNMVYDTMGKVNVVDIDAFKYMLSYGETPMCQVKPIPLTDEILRDWCGFNEELPGMFCREEDVTYTPTGFLKCFIISRFGRNDGKYSALNCGSSRDLEYIHQLQNLIYALTGKELTINIPKQ